MKFNWAFKKLTTSEKTIKGYYFIKGKVNRLTKHFRRINIWRKSGKFRKRLRRGLIKLLITLNLRGRIQIRIND